MSALPAGRIAFIGLGNMGLPMAANVRQAGFDVVGFDVADSARAAAADAGIEVVDSLLATADGAAVALLMLPNSAIVEDVLLVQGLADALPSGAYVLDMSSSDPIRTRALAAPLAERGLHLVDAPVSGGVKGAVAASLTIMVGGTDAEVEALTDLLASMGKATHTGDVGSGHALKALNNLMSGASMLISSEAIEAGRRFGLKDDVMLDVINASTGRSWSTQFKWPTFIIPETYNSGFGLGLQLKDMKIATSLARELGLSSRMGEAVVALFEQAYAELGADADHTEIAKFAADPHDA